MMPPHADDDCGDPAEDEALLAEQDHAHGHGRSRPGFDLRIQPIRERYAAHKLSPWFPLFLFTSKDPQLRNRRSNTRLLLLSLCISLSTAALCLM
jgi:hypothetical protein